MMIKYVMFAVTVTLLAGCELGNNYNCNEETNDEYYCGPSDFLRDGGGGSTSAPEGDEGGSTGGNSGSSGGSTGGSSGDGSADAGGLGNPGNDKDVGKAGEDPGKGGHSAGGGSRGKGDGKGRR